VLRALVATLVAAALIAALPATGLAQDAGSNQYQDPLAGEPGSGGNDSGGGGGGGGNGSAPPTRTQGVESDSDSGTSAAGTPARDQLPATGSDTWLLALAGALLLGGGLGLRRYAERPTA
jgi:LPXTG-motif cell wall-anchored protein